MRSRAGIWSAAVMATFIVERYLPGSTPDERDRDVDRIRSVGEVLSRRGAVHVLSLIVDADEMCMHLFEAEGAPTIAAAHEGAGLTVDRVVEVRMSPVGVRR